LLLDQDPTAIADCTAALAPHVAEGLALESICASVAELLDPRATCASRLRGRDLIYSVGLFDYFDDVALATHVRNFYANLASGGRLVIGNLSPANPDRWLMEYITDWPLFYRTAAELEQATKSLQPAPEQVAVEAEPLGINLFLSVVRGR
jgi:SAM-dependent methyltransferase